MSLYADTAEGYALVQEPADVDHVIIQPPAGQNVVIIQVKRGACGSSSRTHGAMSRVMSAPEALFVVIGVEHFVVEVVLGESAPIAAADILGSSFEQPRARSSSVELLLPRLHEVRARPRRC